MNNHILHILTPTKSEHERVKTFIQENEVTVLSEAITRDDVYSLLMIELSSSQYDDFILLSTNCKITDLT